MGIDPWYKVVTLRKEVRDDRSFSPDEFAIALEQVVAGTAPLDYRDPEQFFSRTFFTRALKEHAGMVLRRLSGKTENTVPVLTLVTQFGGGKTHTLTALYHLANAGAKASQLPGVADLLAEAGVADAPAARVGVFVGNAWDPAKDRETPWIDLARQLAGSDGVDALGAAARTTPPGTDAIARVFSAANAPVLLLLDEVLNFFNRHRDMAESFHAFIQNLTVAATGSNRIVAVISLPRSDVEMNDWDRQWQGRITKVVRRVARDLIANDDSEISEVVRRRLFEDLGKERIHKRVAKIYADWISERAARLPPEWMDVDVPTTGSKGRDFLQSRFQACYPFHPSTLSVFQRKWGALSQFQQTRGTLAMLAQWISWAAREHFAQARREPLITLGSAPLHEPVFCNAVLGQIGESRLNAAIAADLAGPLAHARALDVDTKGPLRDIHRRVGTAIFFESSGGQVDKIAHLPELRFAIGGPDVETTTIDNAAASLEVAGFFVRKIGTEGYRIHHQATLKKVADDRRASLSEETDIRPAVRQLVKDEFTRGAKLPLVFFPEDGAAIQNSSRLTLVIIDPESEWQDDKVMERISQWTKERGRSPRLHPGSLVWCVKKSGSALEDRVARWLAWQLVVKDMNAGVLGAEIDRNDRSKAHAMVKDAEASAKDEVWSGYRFVAIADAKATRGLKDIDIGAGHTSASETLCERIVSALKIEGLLYESIGPSYIDRNWPPAFKDAGAWPLASLRQSFLDGSLTRLIDPDAVLSRKIVEFVKDGTFGLASGAKGDGQYDRLWYEESVGPDEAAFDDDIFLLTKAKAKALRSVPKEPMLQQPVPDPRPDPVPSPSPDSSPGGQTTIRFVGTVPTEVWNRLGTKVLPKLRAGSDLCLSIDLSVSVDSARAESMERELRQVLSDLDLGDRVRIEKS